MPPAPRIPAATAKLQRAIAKAQTLTAEAITIGGRTYAAIIPSQSEAQAIMAGAFRNDIKMRVSVAKTDLPVLPPEGTTLVVARGVTYRFLDADQTFATWEMNLGNPKQ